MSVKHAVLALLTERRGYGYDLAQRFQDRVGPGWQLNPSAIYPALDQLERAGLVTAGPPRDRTRGGTKRSPRVIYSATPAAAATLDAWLHTTVAAPDPVRSELHLKLAFAAEEHCAALTAQLAARERSTAALLAHCRAPELEADANAAEHDTNGAVDAWTADHARRLIDNAVAARLRADLAWLRAVRAALGS